MGYDSIAGIKFAVNGFRDRTMQIWMLFYAAVLFASALVTLALVALLPGLVAADIIVFGLPVSTLAAAVFALLYMLGEVFVWSFFHYQFGKNAMRIAGYPMDGKHNFAQFFLVMLKTLFVNLFSWYDKRVLAAVIVLYVLTALWIAAGYYVHPLMVSVGIGFLAFAMLIHYLGVLLHSVRTMFAPLIYLRDGKDGPKAPMKSFMLVKGQTLDVFIPILIGCVIFGMAALPSYVLAILVVGYPLLALITAGAVLYFASVFRHFDQKGLSEKQKAMAQKK